MLAKISHAFSTWPDVQGWLICLGILIVAFAAIAGIAKWGGLWAYRPKANGHIRRFITALFVPSLGEEVLFRVVLWPLDRSDWPLMALSLALFVLWHMVEGLTFLKAHRAVLLNSYFLVCAAILGTACSFMVLITDSIWPAIITHALLVYIWQSFFDGLEVLSPKAS